MIESTAASVDVYMSVYNCAPYLHRAVSSILNQTMKDFRFIIVNDGSTDGSGEILKKFADQDDRIVLLSQANSGVERASNLAISHCTADFIANFDADDVSSPNRLMDQLSYMRAHPDCVAIDGHHWQIDDHGGRQGHHTPRPGLAEHDAAAFPALEPYLTHTFMMARRDAVNALGGYRPAYRALDADLCWRLLRFGELHHTDIDVGEYRFHAGSISSKATVNGRIAAINSQLCAVSYLRTKAGLKDIVFPESTFNLYTDADPIESLVRDACTQLYPNETDHFRRAVAAKLVELAAYRSFLLDRNDLRFIARHLRNRQIPIRDKVRLYRLRTRIARKLFRKGRWADAANALI